MSALQIQEDDPKLDDVAQDGLVMPLLRSARGADQYPKVEEELPTIKATLTKLEEEKKKKAGSFVATQARNNFNPENFDTFKRQTGNQPNMGMAPGSTAPPRQRVGAGEPGGPGGSLKGGRRLPGYERGGTGTGTAPPEDKLILPDHCLIRVLDVTVKPGESYQYRLRVRMANPNFDRKDVVHPQEADASKPENKELKPNPEKTWYVIPGIVTVPTDLHYYAVDQKAIEGKEYKGAYKDITVGREQTVLQIQKYLEYIAPTPGKNVPVGEWSVAERVVVTRGEIIDRLLRVDVPLLVEEEERWKLASTPGDKGRDPGINVSFEGLKARPAVLVDFDRGRKTYRRAGGDTDVKDDPSEEVLILAPDGKLLAHNAAADAADKDRQDMLKMWRERIEQVRKDNSDPMNPNQGGIQTDSFGRPMRPGGPGGPGGPGDRRNPGGPGGPGR